MSYEKLLALGAEVVCGEVFINHELMGTCTKDGFVMTPAGEAAASQKKPRSRGLATPSDDLVSALGEQ